MAKREYGKSQEVGNDKHAQLCTYSYDSCNGRCNQNANTSLLLASKLASCLTQIRLWDRGINSGLSNFLDKESLQLSNIFQNQLRIYGERNTLRSQKDITLRLERFLPIKHRLFFDTQSQKFMLILRVLRYQNLRLMGCSSPYPRLYQMTFRRYLLLQQIYFIYMAL